MTNEFAIVRTQDKDNKLYLFVNTAKALFRGLKWSELGDFGKRKFENMLFLTNINPQSKHIKIVYDKA
jgi:hypothetical protein